MKRFFGNLLSLDIHTKYQMILLFSLGLVFFTYAKFTGVELSENLPISILLLGLAVTHIGGMCLVEYDRN
ncbi:hypothetical protein ACIQYL_11035 [Lysinibacillus xylanilyticus]|uniref:hypothetical protein n=1 Tax=Lysinibacillus xylanilyticus TaxID=582475 RepID=UPI00382FED0C